MTDAADLTARLIRCPSVTPEAGAALAVPAAPLERHCHRTALRDARAGDRRGGGDDLRGLHTFGSTGTVSGARKSDVVKLVGVAVAAFAFTFSLVPIYRIACEKVFGIRLENSAATAPATSATPAERWVNRVIQEIGKIVTMIARPTTTSAAATTMMNRA